MVDFDVRDAVEEASDDVTRLRHTGGGQIDPATGFATDPTFAEATIRAYVGPVGGERLRRLPEGQATERLLQVIAADTHDGEPTLRTASQADGTLGDLITYGGSDYEVIDVDRFTQGRILDAVVERRDRG